MATIPDLDVIIKDLVDGQVLGASKVINLAEYAKFLHGRLHATRAFLQAFDLEYECNPEDLSGELLIAYEKYLDSEGIIFDEIGPEGENEMRGCQMDELLFGHRNLKAGR